MCQTGLAEGQVEYSGQPTNGASGEKGMQQRQSNRPPVTECQTRPHQDARHTPFVWREGNNNRIHSSAKALHRGIPLNRYDCGSRHERKEQLWRDRHARPHSRPSFPAFPQFVSVLPPHVGQSHNYLEAGYDLEP